jgi:hypothetical protein
MFIYSRSSSLTANMLVTLPTELILNIFRLVDKAGLKTLRLVSKRCNAIAPEILFSSVSASPHTQDLEILRLISEHEDFRHYVREITYFEVYFHFGRHPIIGACSMFKPYSIFEPIESETLEDPTLRPEVHVSTIASAIAKMPNLRRLVLKNHWLPPRDHSSYIYSDEEMGNTALHGPRTSRGFDPMPEKPYGVAVGREGREFDYGFEVMSNALEISGVHLQSFSVDYVQGKDLNWLPDGLHLDTFLKMSPRDVEHACNAFRHLRQISLSLSRWVNNTSGATDNLAKILATTENLEDLKLNFGHTRLLGAHLKDLFGTCTWRRLRTLRLSNALVDGKELANIVYRHRKTLKSLHLWRIYLENDWWTWAESVQPWISSCSLERIEFTPAWYEKRYQSRKLRKRQGGSFWIKLECCLKSYILLGHYKRDCCHTSRFLTKHRTDEEVMRILKGLE